MNYQTLYIILKDLMYKPEPNPFNPRFSQIKVYLLKRIIKIGQKSEERNYY